MSEPISIYATATELATAIADGRLSSQDLLQAYLQRIEERDGSLHAVVTLDAERALAAAKAADEAVARGAKLGSLHGLPMTVKDSFMTAGLRTTSAARELADFVPEEDADPVARLRAAGAIVFGKTNLPKYAGDIQSYNDLFGVTNNPWDVERTVGGSSGGAAAALAAGFTALELGSDIGGSIRNPATMCGVMGHKPSFQIVSALGQIPGPPGTLTQADIAVAGPMARSVDDLELALDVLVGPDAWQSVAWRLGLPAPRHGSLADYRIAAWLDDDSCAVDVEVRSILEAAATTLAAEGATVSYDARPEFELASAINVFEQLLGAAMCGRFSHPQIEEIAASATVSGSDRWAGYHSQRHRGWLSANESRLQMRRKWRQFFEEWDVVLLPVSPLAAIRHDHSRPVNERTITVNGKTREYWDQTHWVGLTGVSYLPATVVPVGNTSDGLPVGLQIAGPYLEDRTTLDLARRLTEIIGGFQPPPGF